MKITDKLLASAAVLAIFLSSSLGGTTNNWFTVNFNDYTENAAIAGVSQTGGAWTKTGADASTVTNLTSPAPAKGMVGKLDTQGGQLTWEPTSASTESTVLIDTDVYLVGSDEAPTTVATGVQTEVYLKNNLDANYEITSSVLCAHVKDTVGNTNAWVELAGVTVDHLSWVTLRIELDYSGTSPKVSFWVDNTLMYKVGDSTATSFDAMDPEKTSVTSVSFMGTGYIDNFIGQQVAGGAAFTTYTQVNGGEPVAAGSYSVSDQNILSVSFASSLNEGADVLQYVQLTDDTGNYVRTYRTSNGNEAVFDVSGFAGNYVITAYYGANVPTVVPDGYKPAASAKAEDNIPAAQVVEDKDTNEKFLHVNVAPVSGLYYTLFVGTDSVDPEDLTAAADSTLAYPDDEDDEALELKMPAPTTANGVNLIKIYASDGSYDANDPAPIPLAQ
ncbi:MAG: hypothetical protein ACOX9C_00470 [Kiritimatiellia bacterium]|jgi:hypothetical protein